MTEATIWFVGLMQLVVLWQIQSATERGLKEVANAIRETKK